ncbi:MAG: SDR family NAD(P)-dependent oxidoreductase [Candidatus Cryosericum sp.]
MRLQNKVIVITGSTRGIGRAIAIACAREGASIVISSRSAEAVQKTVNEMKTQGFGSSGIICDVTVPGALRELLRYAVTTFGKVDVWINNAGLSSGYRPLDEMSPDEIARVVATNVTALATGCSIVIPWMRTHGGGIVINMSGRGGKGEPSPWTALYAATKAAVTSLTRSLAAENKSSNVSIHAVIPGMVATDFYSNIPTSPRCSGELDNLPLVLDAFGVPLDVVGQGFVDIAAQEPGRETGHVYNLLRGKRLSRGILKMTYARITHRLK